MKKSIVFGLVIAILLVANVSAGIYFSQPESYYNLGDIIKVEVEIDPILEGFLSVVLVCEQGAINIFNGLPSEEGKISIKFPLTYSYIKENSGKCYFFGEYFGLEGKGREFEISKALEIRLDIDNLVAKPGEEIVVSGSASRLNGQGINGEIEISIPLLKLTNSIAETEVNKSEEEVEEETEVDEEVNETEEEINESEETEEVEETSEEVIEEAEEVIGVGIGNFYGKVTDGIFSVSFKLNENTPAGDYRIDVRAYEKDDLFKITSEGLKMANLQILQVLKDVDIALNSQNIDPGEILEFRPLLSDQSGQPIKDEVSVIIKNSKTERIFEKILLSEETFQYNIPTNLTAGYYEIEISSGELSNIKTFYVNEKAIARFELKNNTLIVTNIGNIPYKKDIEIEMNGKPFVRKVDLDLQESQEFKLMGDGDYDIKVSDGETEVTGGVALTGHAVNVKAVRKGILALNTPIIWIFFIIILSAGILFFFRNVLKKKSFAYPFKEKLSKLKLRKKSVGGIKEIKKTGEKAGQAEHVLVLKGEKNKAAILVVRFKNKLSKESKKDLEELIKKKKGAIYERDGSLIAVFSPVMTKTFKNEILATKVAESIKSVLEEHNKKSSEKIPFGIGINSGEIVNKIENGKLKFTALGNIVAGANRIAQVFGGKILLTKEAANRAGIEIKTTKQGDLYEVKRIIDSEKNKEFLDGFLKRIGAEKDKKGMADFSF